MPGSINASIPVQPLRNQAQPEMASKPEASFKEDGMSLSPQQARQVKVFERNPESKALFERTLAARTHSRALRPTAVQKSVGNRQSAIPAEPKRTPIKDLRAQSHGTPMPRLSSKSELSAEYGIKRQLASRALSRAPQIAPRAPAPASAPAPVIVRVKKKTSDKRRDLQPVPASQLPKALQKGLKKIKQAEQGAILLSQAELNASKLQGQKLEEEFRISLSTPSHLPAETFNFLESIEKEHGVIAKLKALDALHGVKGFAKIKEIAPNTNKTYKQVIEENLDSWKKSSVRSSEKLAKLTQGNGANNRLSLAQLLSDPESGSLQSKNMIAPFVDNDLTMNPSNGFKICAIKGFRDTPVSNKTGTRLEQSQLAEKTMLARSLVAKALKQSIEDRVRASFEDYVRANNFDQAEGDQEPKYLQLSSAFGVDNGEDIMVELQNIAAREDESQYCGRKPLTNETLQRMVDYSDYLVCIHFNDLVKKLRS